MKLREAREQLKDFRGMDLGKLQDELAKLKREQFNLRFQQATGQLEKTSRVGEVRKSIARVKTAMREKAPPTSV